MQLEKRIEAFASLGNFLRQFASEKPEKQPSVPFNELFFDGFSMLINRAKESNGWFTKDNVTHAINSWSNTLTKNKLEKFTSSYNLDTKTPKTVGVIMAGNIPLVGFHDFLCVLLSGHNALVKLSSNDKFLLPFIAKYLEHIEPEFKGKITFTDKEMEHFDAVIATGSNNTARYFEYYFGKKPHIIRKNRNSVAILTGNETHEQLEGLGEDIFRYFGLGCRSVSKLFIPKQYKFDAFFKAIYKYKDVINYAKYANNYDYNKAVYLMSLFDLQENGFLMLKEDTKYGSPIATLFYEYYDDLDALKAKLEQDTEQIQCVVSDGLTQNSVAFGHTQTPKLNDFADGVNTLTFLSNLS